MKSRWFRPIAALLAAGCLALGSAPSLRWITLAALAVTALLWYFSRRSPASWTPSILFAAYLILTVYSLLQQGNAIWLVSGSCAALAAWEMDHFLRCFTGDTQRPEARLLESRHGRSLGLATVIGWLLALIAILLHFSLPFVIIVLLVVAVCLALERSLHHLQRM